MTAEEIKIVLTAAVDQAVAQIKKASDAVDGVGKSGEKAGESLKDAFKEAQLEAGAIDKVLDTVIGSFGKVISSAVAYENAISKGGTGDFSKAMDEATKSVDDLLASLMTGSPSLLGGIKSVITFFSSAAKTISGLPGPVRTLIGVLTATAAAIALVTKATMAFGVSLKVALGPISLIVSAIAAVIAIVLLLKEYWTEVTLLWQIGVEKMKRYMEILWAGIKIGALYIAKFMIGAARIMFLPMLKAIDAVIWAYNKLTGSHISSVSDMLDSAQESLDGQIAIEQQRLESAKNASAEELALQDQLSQASAERRQRELDEEQKKADAEKKMSNDVRNTRIANAKTEQIQIGKIGAKMAVASKKSVDAQLALEKQQWETSKAGYQEASNFALNNLNQKSRTEFMIWKGLSIAQVMIDTYKAAMGAYAAFTILGPAGIGLGAAAAAAVTALGLRSARNIAAQKFQPKMALGGIVRGSSLGTSVTVGERGMSEAIIPLENPEAQRRLGGMGSTNNININIENMLGDPKDFPVQLAKKIDQALYDLKRNKSSVFAEAI